MRAATSGSEPTTAPNGGQEANAPSPGDTRPPVGPNRDIVKESPLARLSWTDEDTAAYVTTALLPAVKATDALEAAAEIASELNGLRSLGATVWTKAWAAALDRYCGPPPSAGGRRLRRATAAQLRGAQRLFDLCVSSGVEPDAGVYSRLVRAQRDYKACRVAFDFMVLDGTTPDEECVLSVLALCRRTPKTARHKAEGFISFLEYEGVVLTPAVWGGFLSLYADAGDLPGASSVFLRMKEAGVALGVPVFDQFVRACARSPNHSENFEAAELAVAQLTRAGLPLSRQVAASLMRVYAQHKALPRGRRLRETAAEQGVASSAMMYNYARLLRKASRADAADLREAAAIVAKVKERFARTLEQAAKGGCPKARRSYASFAKQKKAWEGGAGQRRASRVKQKEKASRETDLIGDAIKRHLRRREGAKVLVSFHSRVRARGGGWGSVSFFSLVPHGFLRPVLTPLTHTTGRGEEKTAQAHGEGGRRLPPPLRTREGSWRKEYGYIGVIAFFCSRGRTVLLSSSRGRQTV